MYTAQCAALEAFYRDHTEEPKTAVEAAAIVEKRTKAGPGVPLEAGKFQKLCGKLEEKYGTRPVLP